MTVEELIEELKQYPQDIQVVAYGMIIEKDDISIMKHYYNGDSANPNCEVLEQVLTIW